MFIQINGIGLLPTSSIQPIKKIQICELCVCKLINMEFSNGINSLGCKFGLLMPTRNPVYIIL